MLPAAVAPQQLLRVPISLLWENRLLEWLWSRDVFQWLMTGWSLLLSVLVVIGQPSSFGAMIALSALLLSGMVVMISRLEVSFALPRILGSFYFFYLTGLNLLLCGSLLLQGLRDYDNGATSALLAYASLFELFFSAILFSSMVFLLLSFDALLALRLRVKLGVVLAILVQSVKVLVVDVMMQGRSPEFTIIWCANASFCVDSHRIKLSALLSIDLFLLYQVSVWITNWRSGTQQWAIIKSRITVTCFDVSNLVSQHVANVIVATDHEDHVASSVIVSSTITYVNRLVATLSPDRSSSVSNLDVVDEVVVPVVAGKNIAAAATSTHSQIHVSSLPMSHSLGNLSDMQLAGMQCDFISNSRVRQSPSISQPQVFPECDAAESIDDNIANESAVFALGRPGPTIVTLDQLAEMPAFGFFAFSMPVGSAIFDAGCVPIHLPNAFDGNRPFDSSENLHFIPDLPLMPNLDFEVGTGVTNTDDMTLPFEVNGATTVSIIGGVLAADSNTQLPAITRTRLEKPLRHVSLLSATREVSAFAHLPPSLQRVSDAGNRVRRWSHSSMSVISEPESADCDVDIEMPIDNYGDMLVGKEFSNKKFDSPPVPVASAFLATCNRPGPPRMPRYPSNLIKESALAMRHALPPSLRSRLSVIHNAAILEATTAVDRDSLQIPIPSYHPTLTIRTSDTDSVDEVVVPSMITPGRDVSKSNSMWHRITSGFSDNSVGNCVVDTSTRKNCRNVSHQVYSGQNVRDACVPASSGSHIDYSVSGGVGKLGVSGYQNRASSVLQHSVSQVSDILLPIASPKHRRDVSSGRPISMTNAALASSVLPLTGGLDLLPDVRASTLVLRSCFSIEFPTIDISAYSLLGRDAFLLWNYSRLYKAFWYFLFVCCLILNTSGVQLSPLIEWVSWVCVVMFTIISMKMFDRSLLGMLWRDFEFIYLALLMLLFEITSVMQAFAVYERQALYMEVSPSVALADYILWSSAWTFGSFFVVSLDACLTPRRTKIVFLCGWSLNALYSLFKGLFVYPAQASLAGGIWLTPWELCAFSECTDTQNVRLQVFGVITIFCLKYVYSLVKRSRALTIISASVCIDSIESS